MGFFIVTSRYSIAHGAAALSLLLATAFSPVASAELPTPHSYQHPYKFSSDWHTPHLNSWKKALASYVGRPGLRYLEVGVFQGRSFFWVLEEVASHPTSHLTALDINTSFIAVSSRYAPFVPTRLSLSTSDCTISSMKKGLPPVRS